MTLNSEFIRVHAGYTEMLPAVQVKERSLNDNQPWAFRGWAKWPLRMAGIAWEDKQQGEVDLHRTQEGGPIETPGHPSMPYALAGRAMTTVRNAALKA